MVKRAKLRSSTRGPTKTRHTKSNKNTVSLSFGARRYAVPADVVQKLEQELRPHLIEEEIGLPFDEFFIEDGTEIPEWANLLRGLRYREDMTQVEFAEAIGISQANLSAMENGRRAIGKELAKRIGEVFETDYRYFL